MAIGDIIKKVTGIGKARPESVSPTGERTTVGRGGQTVTLIDQGSSKKDVRLLSGSDDSSSSRVSSGPSQAEIEAQRKAEALRIAQQEALKKAEEERRNLEAEKEKARQEKIEAGKISGQVSSKDSGEILPGQTGVAYVSPMFVTEKEERKIIESGGTTRPIYSVPSGGIASEVIKRVNVEQKYVGELNLSNTRNTLLGGELTKGQFESNTAQIQRAKRGAKTELDLIKESEFIEKGFKKDPTQFRGSPGYTEEFTNGGIQYGLGEDYFKSLPAYKARKEFESEYDEEGYLKPEFYNKDLLSARQEFYKLPKGTRAISALGDLGVGVAQAGAGVLEFGADVGKTIYGNFAVRTGKEGELGKDILGFGEFKKQSYFKDLSNVPVSQPLKPAFTLGSIGELVTETPGYLAQGIPGALAIQSIPSSSISLSGTKEGLKLLSPIRIKEGTFTPLAYEMATQKQGAKSLTLQTESGQTTFTTFKGSSGSNVGITQISSKSGKDILGSSFTEAYNVPYLKIESGGSALSFGKTNIYSLAKFTGRQYGNIFKGVADTSFTSAELGYGVQTNVPILGYTKNILQSPRVGLYGFAGGKESALIDKDLFFQVKRYKTAIESPTRGYGVNLDLRGLFKGDKLQGGSNINILRGRGTQTPLSKTFGQNVIQVQKSSFNIPKPSSSATTPTVSGINILTPVRTATANVLFPVQVNNRVIERNISPITQSYGVKLFQPTTTRVRTGQSNIAIQLQSPLLKTKQLQGVSQLQLLRTGQKTIEKQLLKKPIEIIPSFYNFRTPPTIFGGGLLPQPKGSFTGRPTRRRPQRKKQKTGYQVSFTGALAGIRGTGIAPGGLSIRGYLPTSNKII